ncbi:IS66 family insertion sequence element accessory protein TnpA [Photobacterium damselae]
MAIFRKFENSTLTQREFCLRHDISPSTFYAKRRLLGCPSENQ